MTKHYAREINTTIHFHRSGNSSIGSERGYELEGPGTIPGSLRVQTDSGTHPASYPMETVVDFLQDKPAEA
jgi:hypothetical protein